MTKTKRDRNLALLSQRLKTWRGAKTQEEAAELVGVSKHRYESWERKQRMPRDNILRRLAEIGVEVEDLLAEPTVEGEPTIKELAEKIDQLFSIIKGRVVEDAGIPHDQAQAMADDAAERVREQVLAELEQRPAESDQPPAQRTRGRQGQD